MEIFHDIIRQESYLRQSLQNDKKPLGMLIGAGAPMAIRVNIDGDDCPLIPDIAGMTKTICVKLKSGPLSSYFDLVYSHLIEDGIKDLNIEQILSYIRSLLQVAGNGEVRGLKFSELADLDVAICKIIVEIVNKEMPDARSPYHKIAAWIRTILRTCPVELFTTNYDLLMEQALEEFRIPYFDGFVGSRMTFFDPSAIEEDKLPARWARLWKLHGSINWLHDEKGQVYRRFSTENADRTVIYPSHLKYDQSRKMPYLAMIDRLKAFIKLPSAMLITSGYSFKDQHLNETILQALQASSTSIVFALMYGKLEEYPEAFSLAQKSPNLSLLALDGAIIGTKQAPWNTCIDDNQEESISLKRVAGSTTGLFDANFKLGDFDSLGNFFEDIIGEERGRVSE